MRPVLQTIPPQFTVVIMANHGFVEDKRNYTHGGDSYFEKVVPFRVREKGYHDYYFSYILRPT